MRLYWKNILFDYHFFVLYQNIEWGEMISGRVFIVRIFEQKPRNNCTYIKIKIIREKKPLNNWLSAFQPNQH